MRLACLVSLTTVLALPFDVPAQTTTRTTNLEAVRPDAQRRPVADLELPDVMLLDGAPVRTPEAWRQRRNQILELFRENVFGRSPGPPERLRFQLLEEDPQALGGAATLRRVAVVSSQAGRNHSFELTIFLPNSTSGPSPVFLLLNNRSIANTDPVRRKRAEFWPAEEIIARGYGIAALQVAELAPDNEQRFREGVIRLFEGEAHGIRAGNAWGALAAWAWGASRAMDYFETAPGVDPHRIVVVGHSRGGKAALWAGAQDERFALVISNNSGEGGAALSRRRVGETLEDLTRRFPHWFASNYRAFAGREDALPVDQHMLLALVAPRALYIASAVEDLSADPRGEYLALVHASPVYALWGDLPIRADDMPPANGSLSREQRGYHLRAGIHDLTSFDWDRFLNFADSLWR
jgi:hypothetical protein